MALLSRTRPAAPAHSRADVEVLALGIAIFAILLGVVVALPAWPGGVP